MKQTYQLYINKRIVKLFLKFLPQQIYIAMDNAYIFTHNKNMKNLQNSNENKNKNTRIKSRLFGTKITAKNDPLGSYTGTSSDNLGIAPVQDADDL